MEHSYWIWYPGDFELYHAMKQNFSRVERGYGWPAFWKSEAFRNRVTFRRSYELDCTVSFRVKSSSVGFVLAGDRKYPFGADILCGPGRVDIAIHAACIEKFPSVYIEGETVHSDEGWMVEDYAQPPVPAGWSKYFTRPEQDPAHWDYSEKMYAPIRVEPCQDGYLYEFETELTAVLWIQCSPCRMEEITVYCGESREEALDKEHCYYSWRPDPRTGKCPRCAVRFAFIPGAEVGLAAIHQYVDIPTRADFHCGDPVVEKIWAVSAHTFQLCSGIFFIDGVKRDKWIWAGDAYQSLFVNQYLTADADIERRTLVALRGNDPVQTHINTIVDYSLLWLLGVAEHCQAYHDLDFLRQIYPKMRSLMDFCAANTSPEGFLLARPQDWVFIDWAQLDKEGPFGAEQMLLAACWRAMAQTAELLGQDPVPDHNRCAKLIEQIQAHYWDTEKGAFIDSFQSGRRWVSRQTNILAVLFGVADAAQKETILRQVIHNPNIPPITTPYFAFFELELLASVGELDAVWERLHSYWGGMLERGAVTFWEEFDPAVPDTEQYDMYGDRYGKSLCHAWAASPIYLLARYFVSLRQGTQSGGSFVLEPHLEYFPRLDCTLPLGENTGSVHLQWDGKCLCVMADRQGVLHWQGREYPLLPRKKIQL